MVAVVTRVQWFDVKLLYTRSRATDGSTIARGLRGAIYRCGKGVKGFYQRSPGYKYIYEVPLSSRAAATDSQR